MGPHEATGIDGGVSYTGPFPKGSDNSNVGTHIPFSGDFSCSSWNTQALFAASTYKQQHKQRRARTLIHKNDITCFQETHSLEGRTRAFKLPEGYSAVWANGTARQGGIGIVLRNAFLQNFRDIDFDRDLELIEGGRVAILHLTGHLGNLDICCSYLDATSSVERCRVLRCLGRRIRPQVSTLTILAGDFNFVVDEKDRWSTQGDCWADNRDVRDALILHDYVLAPHNLIEWEQPHFTCESTTGGRSRIDRIYVNQHVSMQLDHTCSAHASEWCPDLSAHRPIGISRSKGGGKNLTNKPMQAWALKHEEFANRVHIHYKFLLHTSNMSHNPVSRLLLHKESIKFVHDNIVRDKEVVTANNTEDKLGWALIYLRAIEARNFDRTRHAALCFPKLSSCGKPSHLPCLALNEYDLSLHIQAVRNFVIDLAHEDIRENIQELNHGDRNMREGELARAKDSIIKKLKRLSPGEMSSIACIIDDLGQFHSSPQDMAHVQKLHWEKVFGPGECSSATLRSWLDTLFSKNEDGTWQTSMLNRLHQDWAVTRKHVRKAIRFAKNSMPGPDGVPALAYKSTCDMSVNILYGVYTALASDQAIDILMAAFEGLSGEHCHDFNASILCLLAKKPIGVDDSAGTYFHPKDTRPLSICNVDNRLLASAARLAWEPILERWVSKFQRGFLKGRVMLHNVIDIDWAAMTVSLKCEHGALLLFDFRAAFPSISHPFLMQCLEWLGLPKEAMNFIHSMYHQNKCVMRIQGQDFPGFVILGGVRQGCPLSPLLFAVCVDILLRRIMHEIPGCTCKAFADDIAAVITEWELHGPVLERTFAEFHLISNLALNISKTVCMPLWPNGEQEIANRIQATMPRWANICIASKGTYLGFVMGPGKGTDSWIKPLEKFKQRVARWSQVKAGMQFSAVAYNTFALSTLLYIAQLEPVPDFVLDEERKQVLKMFPGPGTWISPEDLWSLKEHYGLAKSVQSLACIARAAKLRVATLGCHFDCRSISPQSLYRLGNDNIHSRTHTLHRDMSGTEHMDRLCCWGGWYKHNYGKVLVDNVHWLKGKGIVAKNLFHQFVSNPDVWSDEEFQKLRKGLQRVALVAIKALDFESPSTRIREKVERWRQVGWGITGNPGQYCRQIHRRLQALSKLVPPRVCAAVFKTLWNGWCTHRRFQRRLWDTNRCLFGCKGEAEDSLEHYCRCPIVLSVAKDSLKFSYEGVDAMNLWTLNHPWLDSNRDNLRAVGLLIYGTFNAFNTSRQARLSDSNQCRLCIIQYCKQGSSGHHPSMSFLDKRWQYPVAHIV